MRLIFVRHGEPDYDNDCLTADGRAQAESTAKRLQREKIAAVYSSPNGRARETASYTAKAQGIENVRILNFMHEINWGTVPGADRELPYDGHPWTLAYKLLTEDPEYVGNSRWNSHQYFADNLCTEFFARISGQFDDLLLEYGLKRQKGLYVCERACSDTIALFAHGGSGAVMFSHLLSLPFPFVLTTLPYGVCSVSIIEFAGEEGDTIIPRLELFNDMGHIERFRKEKLHFAK